MARSGAVTTGVLPADDEHLVRTGLRAIVNAEADLTVVGEASDGGRQDVSNRQSPRIVWLYHRARGPGWVAALEQIPAGRRLGHGGP